MPDGVPKWTGINQKSELMEDSDPVEVQERERKRYKRREEENPVNS